MSQSFSVREKTLLFGGLTYMPKCFVISVSSLLRRTPKHVSFLLIAAAQSSPKVMFSGIFDRNLDTGLT